MRVRRPGLSVILVLGLLAAPLVVEAQGGGAQPSGEGVAELGKLPDGQVPIPLDTPNPRYADYFLELKKRIEAKWGYPEQALQRHQSGQGVIRFILQKDGSVREVDVLRSTGVRILDRYIVNAVRFASPFPPIPGNVAEDAIPISMNFVYTISTSPRCDGRHAMDAEARC